MRNPVVYAFMIWTTAVLLGGVSFMLREFISGEDRNEVGFYEVLVPLLFIWTISGAASFLAFIILIFIIGIVDSIPTPQLIKCIILIMLASGVCFCCLFYFLAATNLISRSKLDFFFIHLWITYTGSLIVGILLWNRALHKEIAGWFHRFKISNMG